MDGGPGEQGNQEQLLSRQATQSAYVAVPRAAGVGGMGQGKQEFRAKRKGARARVWLKSWTDGATFRACFKGRDTPRC